MLTITCCCPTAIPTLTRDEHTFEYGDTLFNLSGHGNFVMVAYQAYLGVQFEDYEYPQESIEKARENLPVVELLQA